MEHLIEAVRRYPCLWNTAAIEYRDQELKDAAWAEVMKETDLSSVKEVKLKWKKLRDSYRDALKRQSEMLAREPGHPAKKNYPWKYMAHMQFLQPYMSARKKPAGSPPSPPPAADAQPNGADRSSDSSESAPSAGTKRRGVAVERGGGAAALERRLTALCRRAERDQPDPLDIFFNGMCQSTKRFPFPVQIKIKRTLFEAVMAAEEALVAEQQTYASLWAQGAASSSSSSEPEDEKPA